MDLISRQQAVDALNEVVKDHSITDFDAIASILDLPSTQSEIIQCKDCKHKVIENDVWTCPFGLPGGPEFFCGYGAERRTDE